MRASPTENRGTPSLPTLHRDPAATNGDAVLYEKILASARTSETPVLQADSLIPCLVSAIRRSSPARSLRRLRAGPQSEQLGLSSPSCSASVRPHEQAWSYIQSNWDKVHAQFTASSGSRHRPLPLAPSAPSNGVTMWQLFFATHRSMSRPYTLEGHRQHQRLRPASRVAGACPQPVARTAELVPYRKLRCTIPPVRAQKPAAHTGGVFCAKAFSL